MHCDRRHLHAIVVLAYVLILLSVAHVITQSVSTPVELATPPLCLHSPFAGISHAVVLGAPRHTNKFFTCTLNASVRVEADKLLRAAEQVRLMEYEVGLKLYERVKRGSKLVPLLEEEPVKPDQVAFKFVDEYWNDELRDYRFSLKSRCIEETAR